MTTQTSGAKSDDFAGGGLTPIRVVDFGQYLAGPLAAMLLADHGADVIRVDPPGGPRWAHPANAVLQRNKQSIMLDLKQTADNAVARDLIASADVVIEGFRPGVMARLGLASNEMRHLNPQLIWCSIPGFGHDDPRAALAGWEGIVCSAASLYIPHLMGKTGAPVFSALPYASNMAALIAAHSIVAALIARHRYGYGDEIEIPLFDAACEAVALGFEDPPTLSPERIFSMMGSAGIKNSAEQKLYKCRDGRFVFRDSPLRGKHSFWDRYLPEGLKDDNSPAAIETASKLLEELYLTKDAKEWEQIGQDELRMACCVQQTTREWLHDDHALDSETVVRVDDPVLGPTRQPGSGIRVSNCASGVRFPRHEVDADGDNIRQELAGPKNRNIGSQGDTFSPTLEVEDLPLAGIRVLDFSSLLAGPGAGRILAEYGAQVIKINKTAVGLGKIDPTSDEPITFLAHKTTAAGKKTIFLDLKAERGREIARRLCERADIVNHNFAMGVAETLGLGEAELRELQPEMIYSTVTLHGFGGWRESHRGHDHCAQAATGMMMRCGVEGSPQELAILMNDYGTAHISAFGLIVAVFQRLRTGKGGNVEAALSRTATISQMPFMIDFKGQRWNEPHGPDAKGWGPLNRLYECEDGWLYLAAVTKTEVKNLYLIDTLSGIEQLTGHELETMMEERFRGQPRSLWLDLLNAAGVPAHAYHDLVDLMADPILTERGMLLTKEHPGLGRGKVIGIAARFASIPTRTLDPAARPGWHTMEILADLGYGHNEVLDLIASETVVGPMPEGVAIDPL